MNLLEQVGMRQKTGSSKVVKLFGDLEHTSTIFAPGHAAS